MKYFLASFTVTDNRRNTQTIVITQELLVNKHDVVVGAVKHYTLESEDGERVLTTAEPDTFLTQGGKVLRKVSNVHFDDQPETYGDRRR